MKPARGLVLIDPPHEAQLTNSTPPRADPRAGAGRRGCSRCGIRSSCAAPCSRSTVKAAALDARSALVVRVCACAGRFAAAHERQRLVVLNAPCSSMRRWRRGWTPCDAHWAKPGRQPRSTSWLQPGLIARSDLAVVLLPGSKKLQRTSGTRPSSALDRAIRRGGGRRLAHPRLHRDHRPGSQLQRDQAVERGDLGRAWRKRRISCRRGSMPAPPASP